MSTDKMKGTWDGKPVMVVEISMGQFAVESESGETLQTLDVRGLVDAVDSKKLSFQPAAAGRRTRKSRRNHRKTRRYRK
jgi:hypothetical protein